jgi:SAM-dependent methyltransferase
MTPDQTWLAAVWPFVRDNLPAPPARVLEIGCGPLGGFVPELHARGHRAVGIDPECPEGPGYRSVEFERCDSPERVAAIVACTSLHHVADLGEVLDRARAMLVPDGMLVVVEWARERFDEATARWCFERLAPTGDGSGWLHEREAEWRTSGQPWDAYCRGWADEEGLHTAEEILGALASGFDTRRLDYGPYFFAELNDVTPDDEQAAIDFGVIQATRIQYVGTPR